MTKQYPLIALNGSLYMVDKEAEIAPGDMLYSPELRAIVGPTKDRHIWIKGEYRIIASNDPALSTLPSLPEIETGKYIWVVYNPKAGKEQNTTIRVQGFEDEKDADKFMQGYPHLIMLQEWVVDSKQRMYSEKEIQKALDMFTDEAPGFYVKKHFFENLSVISYPTAIEVDLTLIGASWCSVCKDYATQDCLDRHVQGIGEARYKPKVDSNNKIIGRYVYEKEEKES